MRCVLRGLARLGPRGTYVGALRGRLLDLLAGLGVHVPPVLERALEDVALDPPEQVPGDRLHEPLAVLVVPDLAHERAGLTEVVVVRAQRVGLRTISPSVSHSP